MFTIAAGTISSQKIGYLKEVLNELGIKASVVSIKVESGINEQPLTSIETKRGSLNRAKNAFKKEPNSDFAVGIEVGYHKTKDGYEMFCWASIISDKFCISRQSHRFLLPRYHQNILKKKLYLGDNLDNYEKIDEYPVRGHINEIIRHRKSFIESAVKNVILSYFIEIRS